MTTDRGRLTTAIQSRTGSTPPSWPETSRTVPLLRPVLVEQMVAVHRRLRGWLRRWAGAPVSRFLLSRAASRAMGDEVDITMEEGMDKVKIGVVGMVKEGKTGVDMDKDRIGEVVDIKEMEAIKVEGEGEAVEEVGTITEATMVVIGDSKR
jgi:hypothetical protein